MNTFTAGGPGGGATCVGQWVGGGGAGRGAATTALKGAPAVPPPPQNPPNPPRAALQYPVNTTDGPGATGCGVPRCSRVSHGGEGGGGVWTAHRPAPRPERWQGPPFGGNPRRPPPQNPFLFLPETEGLGAPTRDLTTPRPSGDGEDRRLRIAGGPPVHVGEAYLVLRGGRRRPAAPLCGVRPPARGCEGEGACGGPALGVWREAQGSAEGAPGVPKGGRQSVDG